MPKGQKQINRENLAICQEELKAAHTSGDTRQISTAAASLGLAYFQNNKHTEGLRNFREATQMAIELDDLGLQVHCLGMKTFAYQIAARLPDAFKTAQEIEALADEHQDRSIKCDALASQGQILLDSGDEGGAYERFFAAQEIANSLQDKRRQMNIFGALGNYSLVIAAVKQAEENFKKACALAHELNDRKNEIGFLGNLGATLELKGDLGGAAKVFLEVVDYLGEINDLDAQMQALKYLTQIYRKQDDPENVITYALQGIEITKGGDVEVPLVIYEALILAYYQQERKEDALAATIEAVKIAHNSGNRQQELNFLVSLGKSYMLAGRVEEALETYRKARERARKLDRHDDEAYLIGRIGVALAELNQMEDAILHHQEALEIARQMKLVELEGEQLSMLAMAYMDLNDNEKAREYCKAAIQVYSDAKMEAEVKKVHQILEGIDA